MMFVDDDAVVATAAARAAAATAELYAVKGGNGGDHHGADGIEPVLAAALEAAGDHSMRSALEEAGRAAAARTNANAARVADAIIVQAIALGAERANIATNPITGAVRYGSLQKFTAAPW